MSMLAATGYLIPKFTLNILSLSRLKIGGVRCFAANAKNSEFPVKYIPKKKADAKQTKNATCGGNPFSDGKPVRSSESGRRRSSIKNQETPARLPLETEQELDQENKYSGRAADAVNMRHLEEEHIRFQNGTGQSEWHQRIQETNYHGGVLESKDDGRAAGINDKRLPEKFHEQLQNETGQNEQRQSVQRSNYPRGVLESKDGMPTSSDDSARRRSNSNHPEAPARLPSNAEEELNQEDINSEGLAHMEGIRLPKEALRQLQDGVGHSEWHQLIQETSHHSPIVDSKHVDKPDSAQELKFLESGGGQWIKSNEEKSVHAEVVEAEYMSTPDEDFEEMDIVNAEMLGELGGSEATRIRKSVEKMAIELLAKRGFTAVELQKKLTANHFPLNLVHSVINDFRKRGLINDGLYAETFSQSRWNSSTWGPRRIKQALLKKGVSKVDVDKAVKLAFEDGEQGEENINLRLSDSSIEKLYAEASKQWERSKNVPHDKRKARVLRWLQYRGFDWSVVSVILKKLESKRPS